MKTNKGVSIIEGLIATALLLLALGGILSLITQNIKAGKIVDYAYISTNLAKNRVERIREIRREQVTDGPDLISVLSQLSEENVRIDRNGTSSPEGDFRRTTTIDTGYGANLVKVTVRVSYKIMGVWSPTPIELVMVVSPYL